MVAPETLNEAKTALLACLEEIHTHMVRVSEEHWAQVTAAEKRTTEWADKSQLRLGMHRKGNHLQAKWYTVRFYGKGSARRDVKKSIRKSPKEDTFSMAHL